MPLAAEALFGPVIDHTTGLLRIGQGSGALVQPFLAALALDAAFAELEVLAERHPGPVRSRHNRLASGLGLAVVLQGEGLRRLPLDTAWLDSLGVTIDLALKAIELPIEGAQGVISWWRK